VPLKIAFRETLRRDAAVAVVGVLGGRRLAPAAQALDAHLDIAGKEFAAKERPAQPTGATGFGVRLLDRFVAGLEEAIPAARPARGAGAPRPTLRG
jgi:hypothetical protein